MRYVKKTVGLVVIAILATFGSFFVIEVGFRLLALPKIDFSSRNFGGPLYQSFRPGRLFVPSPDRIYKMAPNAGMDSYWQTDSKGFRFNPNHTIESLSSSTQKMLLIGDSFTYGHWVNHNEAYPAQLEKNLLALGKHVRVDNAGIPGYGPDQEFVYLKELLHANTYDVIVWSFTKNDVYDVNNACLYLKTRFGMVQIPGWLNVLFQMLSYAQSDNVIVQKSYMINYFVAGLRGLAGVERYTFGCSQKHPKHDVLLASFDYKVSYFRNSLEQYFRDHGLHTRLVFVLNPFRGDARVRTDPQQNGDSVVENHIDRLLKSFGVPYINTSPVVVALSQQSLLARTSTIENVLGASTGDASTQFFFDEKQFGDDSHLNPAGNALLARIVAKWLLETGVI